MLIDSALMQYQNRPLTVPRARPVPGSAFQAQGTGARLGDQRPIDRNSPLYEQCREFESIFVKMMLKEMRKSVDKSDDIMSGGFAEEIYSDMLDDEYSKTMSRNARFGLADQLYRQLA
jgi:flagellar protein FlgJ